MRIALLYHEHETNQYLIHVLAKIWQRQGHEIISLKGPGARASFDLLFVHVDLSILPAPYLAYLDTLSVPMINGRAIDIRKTLVSRQRVFPGDEWTRPVLVKSVANHMGKSEKIEALQLQKKSPWPKWLRPLFCHHRPPPPLPFERYPVFAGVHEVPAAWWKREDLLVERFLPERDGDFYVLRKYVFLGSKSVQNISRGLDPLVSTETQTESVISHDPPPPEVLELRERLGLDYGKIDYAFCEGKCVVYDANKTIGISDAKSPKVAAYAELLADGITPFLDLCRLDGGRLGADKA